MMKHQFFTLGGIGFRIISDYDYLVDESIQPFISSHLEKWDVQIEISRNFVDAPRVVSEKAGEDLLLEYYFEEDRIICLAKGGAKGPIAVTTCDLNYTHLVCYINPAYSNICYYLNHFLRMLPMRTVLQNKNVLFFHASQIIVGDIGILFTAPSGTGKTTQAKLWNHFRDAEVVCNDRTLVLGSQTFGYPMDGSEPIGKNSMNQLGAIVLLSQASVNSIEKLKPSQSIAKLITQLVIDAWNPVSRANALLRLLELVEKYPVYHLSCTPDEEAVCCLEKRLKEEGVLK